MFKRVVPVLSLILLAGPVFAADTPPPADQSASAPRQEHHHQEAPQQEASQGRDEQRFVRPQVKSKYVSRSPLPAGSFVSPLLQMQRFQLTAPDFLLRYGSFT